MVAELNPAWTNAALARHWAQLERVVGAGRMPVLARRRAPGVRLVAKEYGEGAFGAVMPTGYKRLVAKVTSDPTEAAFVAAALALPSFPAGIVRYHGVVRLSGTRKKRPIYLLWREEADAIGKALRGPAAETLLAYREAAEAFVERVVQGGGRAGLPARLARARAEAAAVRVDPRALASTTTMLAWLDRRGARRSAADALAATLAAARAIAGGRDAAARPVGDALLFYARHGLLITDTHLGNVGLVRRGLLRRPTAALTDPGNVVSLDLGGARAHVRVPDAADARPGDFRW